MIPETHTDILAKAGLATLATLSAAGEPHCSPVWFEWDGQRLRFSLTEDRQKYRNLAADPRIAVSLVDPDNPIHSMEVRGRVTFEPDADRSFINSLSNRYMGLPIYPLPDTAPRVIGTVEIDHVTTWL